MGVLCVLVLVHMIRDAYPRRGEVIVGYVCGLVPPWGGDWRGERRIIITKIFPIIKKPIVCMTVHKACSLL
jgi:hypothetical protein